MPSCRALLLAPPLLLLLLLSLSLSSSLARGEPCTTVVQIVNQYNKFVPSIYSPPGVLMREPLVLQLPTFCVDTPVAYCVARSAPAFALTTELCARPSAFSALDCDASTLRLHDESSPLQFVGSPVPVRTDPSRNNVESPWNLVVNMTSAFSFETRVALGALTFINYTDYFNVLCLGSNSSKAAPRLRRRADHRRLRHRALSPLSASRLSTPPLATWYAGHQVLVFLPSDPVMFGLVTMQAVLPPTLRPPGLSSQALAEGMRVSIVPFAPQGYGAAMQWRFCTLDAFGSTPACGAWLPMPPQAQADGGVVVNLPQEIPIAVNASSVQVELRTDPAQPELPGAFAFLTTMGPNEQVPLW